MIFNQSESNEPIKIFKTILNYKNFFPIRNKNVHCPIKTRTNFERYNTSNQQCQLLANKMLLPVPENNHFSFYFIITYIFRFVSSLDSSFIVKFPKLTSCR